MTTIANHRPAQSIPQGMQIAMMTCPPREPLRSLRIHFARSATAALTRVHAGLPRPSVVRMPRVAR